MPARVREAEARLRAEEERRRSGQQEAEARQREEEEREGERSAREAELRQRLAAVEAAERRLQQEDQRQQRALDARTAAEERDLQGGATRGGAVEEGEHRELRSLWHGGPTAASLASPAGSKRRSPSLSLNLGGSGRVIPRRTPPASPTDELQGQAARDFPETAAVREGQYPAHPALALDRPPTGGVSDSDPLQTLADTPATGWVSPASAAKAAAAEAEAAAAAAAEAAHGAQGSEGDRRMSRGALEVLGAVSQEEYHGIVEYAAYLPWPPPTPITLPLTRPLPLPLTRYAAYLGMDPVADVHLLWIARDALHASVPAPWVEGLDMRER